MTNTLITLLLNNLSNPVTYNPVTMETVARGSLVQGQPGQQMADPFCEKLCIVVTGRTSDIFVIHSYRFTFLEKLQKTGCSGLNYQIVKQLEGIFRNTQLCKQKHEPLKTLLCPLLCLYTICQCCALGQVLQSRIFFKKLIN